MNMKFKINNTRWKYLGVLFGAIVLALLSLTALIIKGAEKTSVPFEDVSKSFNCISSGMSDKEKNFAVTSRNDLEDLFKTYKFPSLFCENFTLPNVDFNKSVLLGKYTSTFGCSGGFTRKVYLDNVDKKIIYEIKVFSDGSCEKLTSSMNWILISKPPLGYAFEFLVN